jgi:hypothetical protein
MATPYYFSDDGSWGVAEGLVIVDENDVHEHLFDIVDECLDSERAPFAEWFKNNDHEPVPTDNEQGISNGRCGACDEWDS